MDGVIWWKGNADIEERLDRGCNLQSVEGEVSPESCGHDAQRADVGIHAVDGGAELIDVEGAGEIYGGVGCVFVLKHEAIIWQGDDKVGGRFREDIPSSVGIPRPRPFVGEAEKGPAGW